ncbi:hypothetical protein A5647_15290 [Mycobacterium sp. 1100029.7]|nr:hypothetical protein A5647_15290 [Mycobacterium sp. 1100029.7]
MLSFDDLGRFAKVLELEVPWAHSYADMEPGKTDRERHENYRKAALGKSKAIPENVAWWAFRVDVAQGGHPLDVENVANAIIDAFCSRQIGR